MPRTSNGAVSAKYAQIESTGYPHRPVKWFDYLIPPDMGIVQPGQIVAIPFGRQKVLGVVRAVSLSTKTPASKLKSIDRILVSEPLPEHLLKLADWIGDFYQASPHAIWQSLLPQGLTVKSRRASNDPVTPRQLPRIDTLSPEQATVLEAIKSQPELPSLIHGITGSGKTQIYESLIQDALEAGTSSLVLAPEIILTQHLADRLRERFGDRLIVAHSGLTAAQRRNIWLDCHASASPMVYLGPRSTLFLPIHRLGLIIIDEEHDSSYKQEQSPRYQTIHVAARLHQLTRARLVLGSATPSITTLALVKAKKIVQLSLTQRYGGAQLPEIVFIPHKNRDGIFAPDLIQALRQTVTQGKQAIILINRRGSARRLSCDDCGESVRCTHCDTPLVLHADLGRMRCHLCGRDTWPPTHCPSCRSVEVHYHGVGSKRALEELAKLIPDARISRLDRDIEPQTGTKTIESMLAHKIDILVGTQMIAKGLDFPQVTLVGILQVDDLIAGADWMSAERAVGLILQAAGRSGRGQHTGRVLIQTHRPDRPLFDFIKRHDWDGFAAQEMAHRQKYGYPPFRWLMRLTIRRTKLSAAEAQANQLAEKLHSASIELNRYEVLGPSTPLRARSGSWHTMQIVVKAPLRRDLVKIAADLETDWAIDLDPIQVL